MAANRRLRVARVLAGLTQLQIAERIGGREADISRYETGRAKPDAETRRRIAAALGKPVHELFSDGGQP